MLEIYQRARACLQRNLRILDDRDIDRTNLLQSDRICLQSFVFI